MEMRGFSRQWKIALGRGDRCPSLQPAVVGLSIGVCRAPHAEKQDSKERTTTHVQASCWTSAHLILQHQLHAPDVGSHVGVGGGGGANEPGWIPVF